MRRSIAIGDIHGALKAFEELIKKLELREGDRLIFLGDYVDGWPDSAQVVEYLINLSRAYPCIFLKGNHDLWCETWLSGEMADPEWLYHGGDATLKSYQRVAEEDFPDHLSFFEQLKHYYVDESDRLFIHAGFSADEGPNDESDDYAWDRTLWESALFLDKRMKQDPNFISERLSNYREIFIGHTPTLNYGIDEPMHACNVWNIDTGAAFSGKLTAIDVDTKNYWQSEKVQRLYPDVKGRRK